MTFSLNHTASAAYFNTAYPCPSSLTDYPLVESSKIPGTDYYQVQSNGTIEDVIVITVKSDNKTDSLTQADDIINSGLTPAWSQAKVFIKNRYVTGYYCAYTSSQFTLSTQPPNFKKPSAVPSADYIVQVVSNS